MGQWYFKPKEKGDSNREPIHGEFFAADAISEPGCALVREGIQNSLDAARPGELVQVRVYLSGQREALPTEESRRYFQGLRPHLEAPANGLRTAELPPSDAPCDFLVFEDFGTTGLEGDPDEAFRPKSGGKNRFYHFFRAEGQSDKDVTDRGSWGIGKHVFFRASRLSAVLAVTVRASDRRRLLFGKCVLKSHWCDDAYCQDGYYGHRASGSKFVTPVEADGPVKRFCDSFRLRRGASPGLSIVVPWPDPEITQEAIARAVVADYFWAILARQLVVCVEGPDRKTTLDADSLTSELQGMDAETVREYGPLVRLASWSRNVRDADRFTLNRPPENRAWEWSEALVPDQMHALLAERYLQGQPCAVRIPVAVRKRGAAPQRSYFDVYLQRDVSDHRGRPIFIREGIVISRVAAPRSRAARGIVVAEHGPIAEFLRAAENPSHTEWQRSLVKGTYISGVSDLRFVQQSVSRLADILTQADRQEDPNLLVDFFSLPASEDRQPAAAGSRADRAGAEEAAGEPEQPEGPTIEASGQPFRIAKVAGGFAVLPGDHARVPPRYLDIYVAYNVRQGNPLKRYHAADFAVDRDPIRFEPEPRGLAVLGRSANRIQIEIRDPDFRLHVTGFDRNRDLYVRAVPGEAPDAHSTD